MKKPIVHSGRTGSGKSKKMKANIVAVVGRHLLVVPRKMSIDECTRDLKELCEEQGISMDIFAFRREARKNQRTKIAKEISDKASKYQDETEHVCLIVTQAAFQKLDPTDFHGWHLKLDELLANGNPSGSLFAPVVWVALASIFAIAPLTEEDRRRGVDPSLRRLVVVEGFEAKDVFADPFLSSEIENLYQRVISPIPVYIDAQQIEDVAKRRCEWCSPWTLDYAEDYDTIEIAASDIELSLMHNLSPRDYEFRPATITTSSASVRIRYFDDGEATCSSEYWTSAEGKGNLALIGKELASRGEVDFWTCNESAEATLKPLMPRTSANREDKTMMPNEGTWITQQQDGTNDFRDCLSCAILISSKAQKHEQIFAKLNAKATRAAISKAREDGLIFQFTTRGAIRMANFAGTYEIFVYDRQQAEALRAKLKSYDWPDTEIEHVALAGFVNRVRKARGRPEIYRTPDERAAAKKHQNAARQQRHREKASRSRTTCMLDCERAEPRHA